jgi:hypothetical protein
MSSTTTFMDACFAGRALLDDVDDWVEAWHDAGGKPRGRAESLKSYLGLNDFEYSLWAEKPSMLRLIVAARYQGVPVEDVRSAAKFSLAAARAADDQDAIQLLEWLQKTGRLAANDVK